MCKRCGPLASRCHSASVFGLLKQDTNQIEFNMFLGQLIEQSAKTFFNKCERCKLETRGPKCEFVGCDKRKESKVICSEVESICSITLICGNTIVFTKNNL